ncbi:DUF6168 family protein [Pricia sp. S334]|uniref:DUF6168 family protein n=1 Tax=Pricia mediterranea TaxID=3076079 RepID=A0ABU3L5H2_9FLAO|nr:DUF6168 family protein [Pricia sp. S334]MDT7828979.1 DUF6168 family protein [Pricia sp. S334]
MHKIIISYIVSFGLLLLVGFSAHQSIMDYLGKSLDFSLLHSYLFHAVFSCAICTSLLTLSKLPQFRAQLGFIYLGGLLLKLLAFAGIFQDIVLRENPISTASSVSLLVPIALFLSLEVYFIAKLLRRIDTKFK